MRDAQGVAGFTLVELMVSLAVAAILAALAMPSLRAFLDNGRAATQANEVLAAFNLARSEAITRAADVSVCTVVDRDALQCARAGEDGRSWQDGWLVFTDAGVRGEIDGGDEVLRAFAALAGGVTLSTAAPYLTYTPTGALQVPPLAPQVAPIRFELRRAACHGTAQRDITISALGRPTMTHVPC